MGMVCAYQAVSDDNLDRILAKPPLIWRLIAPDDPEIYVQTISEAAKSGFLQRAFKRTRTDEAVSVPDLNLVDGEQVDGDLDKSWHGIHFCLNGTAYEAPAPMDFITMGGQSVGDIDVGYGPARAFRANAVRELSSVLDPIGVDQLRRNYDPGKMAELDIYPDIWERDGEEGFEYIAEYYESLKQFIAHCVQHSLGMVLYIC